jgi:cardiolipin synthase
MKNPLRRANKAGSKPEADLRSFQYLADNEVRLLYCGVEFFPALIAAIDAARFDIHYETYIYGDDETGDEVQAALLRAAARGVSVYLMVDWFGTGNAKVKKMQLELGQGGVHMRVFNPWFRRGITRTHRKICVVDREVGFVGGINTNDDWVCDYRPGERLPAPRWDFAVQVRGPLVDRIHQEVQAQWTRLGQMNLIRRIGLYREMRRRSKVVTDNPVVAAFVVRDNLRNRRTIQRAYLHALGRARHSVLLANPYFAPGRKLREALARAAARGVDVTLLIGTGEFKLQDAVAQSFYPKLIASGVRVVEYRKTQLHAKVAVIDDLWATVGSSNCDGLSLFLNQEANVVVRDPVFAATLRRHIEYGIVDGVEVRLEEFDHAGWWRRIRNGAAYLFYRFVMRIFDIGYA